MPDRAPMSYLIVALALHALLVAVVVRWIGTSGWDDGAITLAYSKTFAETGRVALTAISEQVEGFSSVGWFFVNAALALLRPSFEHAIMLAQIATGVCQCAVLALTWSLARGCGVRSATTLAILVVLALFGPAFVEVANGMEMTFLAASGLALIHTLYLRWRPAVFLILTVAFLSARFEAMFYYAALLVPLLLQRRYKAFVALAGYGLLIAGLEEVWRWFTFGDVVPNTIRAKTHEPYSSSGAAALYAHFRGWLEAVASLFPLLFAGLAALAFSRSARADLRACLRHPDRVPDCVIILAAPIAAVIVFCTLAGKNWGYTGRMEFLALPCGLILAGLLFDRYLSPFVERWTGARLALLGGLTIVTLGFSWHQSAAGPIALALRRAGGEDTAAYPGIDPETYRRTALAVDEVRGLAKLDGLVFLTPDVGGVGLCCSRLRVVDAGLLTNGQLARAGYAAFPQVFAREEPAVISIHLMWATLSGIYANPAFVAHYQPALVHDTRLYIRDDIVSTIGRDRTLTFCSTDDPNCRERALHRHRYVGTPTAMDDAAFLRRGRILVID